MRMSTARASSRSATSCRPRSTRCLRCRRATAKSSPPRSATTTVCAPSSRPPRFANDSSARSRGCELPGGHVMERSELALSRARSAYERARVLVGVRGVVLAGLLALLAVGLHRTAATTWLVAAGLAIALGMFGWRGGSWRRGALAGVIAGLPVFVAPTILFAILHGRLQCPDCALGPTLPCLLACFGTSSLVGTIVGGYALRDRLPRRFAAGALACAALTGLLGCATTGFGGAVGIVIGIAAGGATGWLVAGRAAHA